MGRLALTWPTVTRRDLRLWSGLLLVAYVATHLLNHALGLISVDVAEAGLDIAMRVWQSGAGTVLLYGAAAVHLALAFDAIYRRRTLRMPPLEILRIWLGLGIPTLLIGHIAATRLGYELYGQQPHYHRVVWALWRNGAQGWQLALLVPGWLHGCLGVHFAFSRGRWYERSAPLLFAIAILLPVLGALGFLAMGKELAFDKSMQATLDANIVVHSAGRAVVRQISSTLLAFYFGSIAAVFLLREWRSFLEKRRKALVSVRFPQRVVQVPRGWSVLDASRSHHLAHLSLCGGQARCSTCRVRVTAGEAHCPPPGDAERATLARIRAGKGVRLACQLRPTGEVTVVPLLSAASGGLLGATPPPSTEERELALLQVRWLDRGHFAEAQLPQDMVFLSRLFSEAVGSAVRAAGAVEIDPANDLVCAVFGTDSDLPTACRQALAAAAKAELALAELAHRIERDFDRRPLFRIVADAGLAALGEIGLQGSNRLSAAGPLIERVKRLDQGDAPIVLGAAVLDAAGVASTGLDWHEIELPRSTSPMRAAALSSFSQMPS